MVPQTRGLHSPFGCLGTGVSLRCCPLPSNLRIASHRKKPQPHLTGEAAASRLDTLLPSWLPSPEGSVWTKVPRPARIPTRHEVPTRPKVAAGTDPQPCRSLAAPGARGRRPARELTSGAQRQPEQLQQLRPQLARVQAQHGSRGPPRSRRPLGSAPARLR